MTKLIAFALTAMMAASCAPPSGGNDTGLSGRSIAFIGDSVSYGTNYEGGYGKLIGEAENMTVTNTSRGGATIARNITWSADSDGLRPCIIDMAEGLEGELDYIVIEGGINDFWNHAPIGELTEGFEGGYNDETTAGGLEIIFSNLKEKHPESKLGFVIIHDPFTYDAEADFEKYYELIKAACDKWSVPYLDLYAANNQTTGINVRDAWTKQTYFGSEERPQGDGTHPNEEGYRVIYVEPMIEWLKGM